MVVGGSSKSFSDRYSRRKPGTDTVFPRIHDGSGNQDAETLPCNCMPPVSFVSIFLTFFPPTSSKRTHISTRHPPDSVPSILPNVMAIFGVL